MGLFEDIAVLDMKFRIVITVLTITFIVVYFPIRHVSSSAAGFGIGAIAAVGTAYFTAKRLP